MKQVESGARTKTVGTSDPLFWGCSVFSADCGIFFISHSYIYAYYQVYSTALKSFLHENWEEIGIFHRNDQQLFQLEFI
jgi:hypothetical protein